MTAALACLALSTGPSRAIPGPGGPSVAADEIMAEATIAMDSGRLDDADALYRLILAEDPDHDAAFHALWGLSRGQALPPSSPTAARARTLLPDTFVEHETKRYLVLSDADPRWVREQAGRLERAYDRFIRFANRLDLRPLPLRHKLVAIVFADRAEFASFAGRHDTPVGPRIAGYYSPAADWLVFYHVESDENVAAARQALEGMLAEIDDLRRASRRARNLGHRDEAQALRAFMEGRETRLDDAEARLNWFAHRQSIMVTVHEAVHQLMFHTGVQAPHVRHPLWLTEGLATAFETDNPAGPFGPDREFAPRREGFYHLLDNGLLVPVRDLVALDDDVLRDHPDPSAVVYHQGYALVTWMCRSRKIELREYLRRLNALPPGVPTPERHLEVFEAAFGDADKLEKRWLMTEQ
ncbi:MAG: DUF1570 domain-containing protein [Planctomycetota bacterium]